MISHHNCRGLTLDHSVHGQLYTGRSRVRHRADMLTLFSESDEELTTMNVVHIPRTIAVDYSFQSPRPICISEELPMQNVFVCVVIHISIGWIVCI